MVNNAKIGFGKKHHYAMFLVVAVSLDLLSVSNYPTIYRLTALCFDKY